MCNLYDEYDYFSSGLCPDWCEMKPENALQNAKEAMGLADNWLGVPQVYLLRQIAGFKRTFYINLNPLVWIA